MASIELRNIEKRYGETPVVRGIDLTISDGEFVVLVGPSGCGKSTLLRMVAGLEEITSGTLLIDGVPSNDVSPGDRDLAMVFQSYALYPHMTVRDNMGFGLSVRRLPQAEIRRRVDDVAQMLGLETLLDRKPAQLSGGQRQRVAMGRAIVRRPRAFLFDEPLSNLDAKLRAEVRAEIARLRRRLGTTTLYVTHDQVEAMTLADRVVILNEGKIQQVGPPLDVYRRPANRFVASFLGTPTINFIDGAPDGSVFAAPGEEAIHLPHPVPERTASIAIRPHDLEGAPAMRPEWSVQFGRLDVDHVEWLGSECFVFGQFGGRRVAARVAEDAPVQVGDRMVVGSAAERILFFDRGGARVEA